MINLTTVSDLIKKLALPVVVVLIIGLLSLLIFVRFSPPKIDQEPLMPQVEPPHFDTLHGMAKQFKTDQLSVQENIPSRLPVYNLNLQASFLPEANNLAQKLNFTAQPKELNDLNLGQGLLFTTNDSALSVYQQVITYQKTFPNTEDFFNEAILKVKAFNFITSLGIPSIDLGQESKTTYIKLTNEGPIPVDNPIDANRVKFDFSQTINDLEIITEDNLYQITLDASGNVTGFTFKVYGVGNELGNYPIIRISDALKQLRTEKGSLIKIEGERADVESLKHLGDVSLIKAYLAYYFPTKAQSTIQPVWVFEGESLINKLKITPTYVVPAVTSD